MGARRNREQAVDINGEYVRQRINEFADKNQITLETFNELLGRSKTYVQMRCKGNRIGVETLRKVCKMTGIKYEDAVTDYIPVIDDIQFAPSDEDELLTQILHNQDVILNTLQQLLKLEIERVRKHDKR